VSSPLAQNPSSKTVSRPASDNAVTVRTLAALAAVAVCLAILPFTLNVATTRFATEFLLYLSLATAWNLMAGYGGLISVGQQAYVGLGGYAFAVGFSFWGLPLPLAILLGAMTALVAAAIFAPLLLRLAGPHFAIGTWVMAELCLLIVANAPALGGGSGLSLPASLIRQIAASREGRETVIYLYALLLAVLAIGGAYLLLRSKWGLALTAMRDSSRAAESLGVNTTLIKVGVFVACAAHIGAVGAVIFLSRLRMTPDSAFSLTDWTAYVVFIVIIGGIRRIEGPIVGTVVFFTLRSTLSDLGPIYLIVLGLIATAVMVWAPDGLWGLVAKKFPTGLFRIPRRSQSD
jgi:branched-chain amino acid transport system permease protein